MRTLTIITLILLTSCSLTKEERRLNRATKKLDKLVQKFPELKKPDTLQIPVEMVTIRTQVDTVTTITTDTVTIRENNLTIRYKVDTILNTVWVQGVCDTIIMRDTIRVTVDRIQPVKVVPSSKGKWLQWALIWLVVLVVLVIMFKR